MMLAINHETSGIYQVQQSPLEILDEKKICFLKIRFASPCSHPTCSVYFNSQAGEPEDQEALEMRLAGEKPWIYFSGDLVYFSRI